MPVTTATYSGRFIRPSSFRQATPMSWAFRSSPARQLSFRDGDAPWQGRQAVGAGGRAGRRPPAAAAAADEGALK